MPPLAILRRWSRLLAVLALLALASRLWVPVGFMPVAQAQPLTLAICNPQGGGYAMVVETGQEPVTHDGVLTCPYCLLLGASGPAPDPNVWTPRDTALIRLPLLRTGETQTPAPIAGPPLGQRAPPAHI